MRYSGFNIQKENITRRAKKPFQIIKQHNFLNPYKAPEKRVHIPSVRPEPAYRKWWILIVCLMFISLATLWFRYQLVVKPELREEAILKFEEEGMLSHFNENKSLLDSIHRFVLSTNGRLFELGKGSNNGIDLSIKSDLLEKGYLRERYEPRKPDAIIYRIKDGVLKYESIHYQTMSRVLREEESWVLNMNIRNIDEVDKSFIQHLSTSYGELDHYLRNLYDREWWFGIYSGYQEWHFSHLDEDYKLLIFDKADETPSTPYVVYHRLKPGVYWRRN